MKNRMIVPSIIVLFILVCFTGCFEDTPDESTILYVDDSGGETYMTIQDAIDASVKGDTIYVREGTYCEEINISTSIRLIGSNRETTVIQQQNPEAQIIVGINAEACEFKGFKVIGLDGDTKMKGISVNTSYNTITECEVTNTWEGIYIAEGSNSNNVTNTVLFDNQYGISAIKSSEDIFTDNELISNNLYGIYIHLSDDCIVSGNTVTYSTTGIRIKGSDGTLVYHNSIANNDRGVLCCCGAASNTIYQNNFEQNADNARDDVLNFWDNGEYGNYWDDYEEKYPDATQTNGIWNTPYNITIAYGDDHIYDNYPLVNPVEI